MQPQWWLNCHRLLVAAAVAAGQQSAMGRGGVCFGYDVGMHGAWMRVGVRAVAGCMPAA